MDTLDITLRLKPIINEIAERKEESRIIGEMLKETQLSMQKLNDEIAELKLSIFRLNH